VIDVGRRDRAATVSVPSSVTLPDCARLVITGRSLLPWMVMVTVCAVVAPWSSVTVTGKVSVSVSVADRLWLWPACSSTRGGGIDREGAVAVVASPLKPSTAS